MRKWIQRLWSSLRRLAAGSQRSLPLRWGGEGRGGKEPPPSVAAWELRLLGLQQEIGTGTERTASRLDELHRSLTTMAGRLELAEAQTQAARADLLTSLSAVQAALDRTAQAHAESTQGALGTLQGDLAGSMAELRATLAGLQEGVSALDKQLSRTGREQLKANTLFEAQQQQTQTALDQMRDHLARREAELVELRDRLRADQAAARLQVVERLLPALDGLHEALAAGHSLIERVPEPAPTPPANFGERLAQVFGFRPQRAVPAGGASDVTQLRTALDAWLHGLTFVEERLLEVLGMEDIHPIPTQDEPFDPHRHIAVDSILATNGVLPGTIVAEFRRGYTVGEHILRPAEVVVAKNYEEGINE